MVDRFEGGIWPHFWDAPHKSLFLGAYMCAFLTVGWWPLGVGLGMAPPAFSPVTLWHVHELIFGFAGAALGGYLLTALPNWTRQEPIAGWPIILLVSLWVGARISTSLIDLLPHALPVIFNSGYFIMLAAILCARPIQARAIRGVLFGIGVLAIGGAQSLFLISVQAEAIWIAYALAQSVVIGFALLMVVVGTRAIPAFTNNWFMKTDQAERLIAEQSTARLLAQLFLVGALLGSLAGLQAATSIALVLAAVALAYSMVGWRTVWIVKEPLLVALHFSFLWIPLGLLAVAILRLVPEVYPPSAVIHTLTIGAMSGLIMGISGRAAAHQRSGEMKAGPFFLAGYTLVWIATVVRLIAPLIPESESALLIGAASSWCMGWIAFIVGFVPALKGPSPRPVLSGKKSKGDAAGEANVYL